MIEGQGHTIFWPPGPEPLRYDSSISDSGGAFGRGGRAFPAHNEVVDVKGLTSRVPEVNSLAVFNGRRSLSIVMRLYGHWWW